MVAPKNMTDIVDDFIKFLNLKPDQMLMSLVYILSAFHQETLSWLHPRI